MPAVPGGGQHRAILAGVQAVRPRCAPGAAPGHRLRVTHPKPAQEHPKNGHNRAQRRLDRPRPFRDDKHRGTLVAGEAPDLARRLEPLPLPCNFDEETRARAVRLYQDRLRDHRESKLAARRHVGQLLDINPATLRNWIEAEKRRVRRPTGRARAARDGAACWCYLQYKNWRRYWDPATEQAGIKALPHDLRATCVSLLIDAGASPKDVQLHMGHSSIEVTMNVYARIRGGRSADLAARLDALIAQAG